MAKAYNIHKYLVPLVIYIAIISLIFLMEQFISGPYSISASALLMLSVPLILKTDMSDLRWEIGRAHV